MTRAISVVGQGRYRRGRVLVAMLAVTLLSLPVNGQAASGSSDMQILVLSNRADLISGGDALVRVVLPNGVASADVTLDIDGRNVTSEFAARPNGKFEGLLTDLELGPNVVTAKLPDATGATITITNHPIGGPVFSGPQIQPWGCDDGAQDVQCNRPISYALVYKPTGSGGSLTCTRGLPRLPGPAGLVSYAADGVTCPVFQPYDPESPPSDVATTTTDEGTTVPFIVRLEIGVQDRDYYKIAVLYDPAEPWTPWTPQRGWNRKVLAIHGGRCGMGFKQWKGYSVMDERALSRGFAVMTTSLNDTGHNCGNILQAESMMMAKEHLIESYGEIRYLFGQGGSGGALAQEWMANSYPGIYDGIIVGASFPDAGSTAQEVEDCALLRGYFEDPSRWSPGVTWHDTAAMAAAAGHQTLQVCAEWAEEFHFNYIWSPSAGMTYDDFAFAAADTAGSPLVAPTATGGCNAPTLEVYHPLLNPNGVRCSIQDYSVNALGRRAPDGFANRPLDNVGIQYGLQALEQDEITPAQFADLNAKIGSHDIDYVWQSGRVAADRPALTAAYRSGFINEANGMENVAMIDVRGVDTSGLHHQFRAWAMRARMDRAYGHHDNNVIWFNGGSTTEAIDAMDDWLAAVEADTSNQPRAAKLVADKPTSLKDRCGAQDGTGLSMPACTGVSDASVRMGAGGQLTDDNVACQLKPLSRSDYSVAFTDAQWSQLESAFPLGVCDYTEPGVEQQATVPWMRYGDATSHLFGGAPLGQAPVSSPL